MKLRKIIENIEELEKDIEKKEKEYYKAKETLKEFEKKHIGIVTGELLDSKGLVEFIIKTVKEVK